MAFLRLLRLWCRLRLRDIPGAAVSIGAEDDLAVPELLVDHAPVRRHALLPQGRPPRAGTLRLRNDPYTHSQTGIIQGHDTQHLNSEVNIFSLPVPRHLVRTVDWRLALACACFHLNDSGYMDVLMIDRWVRTALRLAARPLF